MKSQRNIIIASIVLLIGIFAGGTYLFKKNQQAKFDFMALENSEIFVREHSPMMGPADAKVYLVEFLDPECESCRAFYTHVKDILKKYEKDVRFVIRYVPYHQNSRQAIAILEASKKQNKYWETLEVLFKYQPEWGDHHHPRPELMWNYLPEIGLDIDKLRADSLDPKIATIIDTDFNDAKTLQIRGTPTFFINGKMLMDFGAVQLEAAVKKAVEE